MKPNMLRILAFFYLTITSTHATLIPFIIGGILAANVVKHLDDFWKQQLGPDTQMPKSIQDCIKGSVGSQVGVDGKSLIRFESFVNPKGTSDISVITSDRNENAVANPSALSSNNQTSNQQTSAQQQQQQQQQQQSKTDQQSSTKGLGPPKSSATDMAQSYGAPLGMNKSTETMTTETKTTTTTTVETITKVEKSVQSMFFTDKDLSVGRKMDLNFEVSSNEAAFLPRETADKLQFTTANFNAILDAFNLTATSKQALIMMEALNYCEDDKPGDKCCNSLESMVEFAKSIVGPSTKAISTMVDKNRNLEYHVQGFRNLPTEDKAVLCHKIPFPCAFFYCQKLEKAAVFLATLVAVDGSTINAPAVCHHDTKAWDPGHWVFKQLNATPGSCHICHFLLDDDVLWIVKV